MRLLLTLFVLFAAAVAQSDSALEARAIAVAKRTSAKKLDGQLPGQPFAAWLTDAMPKGTTFEWESNDCGEQTGDPSTTPADPPLCAQVTASKGADRLAVIMIVVGTLKKGVAGKPAVFFISADRNGSFQPVKALHDIPKSF